MQARPCSTPVSAARWRRAQVPHVHALAAAQRPRTPKRLGVARARAELQPQQQQQQPSGGSGGNSDLAFVAKGAALSFAGGAAIKYGSLLFELPHRPDAAVALTLVLGPPLAYAGWLLARGGSGGDGGETQA